MAEALVSLGLDVHVATTTANGRGELNVPLDRPVVERGVRYFYFARQRPKAWTFSWPLTRWLEQYVASYDVLHVHALFSYPTLPACRAARRYAVPYVLRPLGTLDPWALRFHRRRKAVYFRLFERRNLLGAAAVHAVSEGERLAIEALGLPVRVVTIPLGIDRATAGGSALGVGWNDSNKGDLTNVLFLSRLHPKKGLEILLDAVERLSRRTRRMRLVVAGDGDAAYVQNLKDRTARCGLDEVVTFTGFVEGAEKERLLQAADLFVLPSYDENFGIAVGEALSVGLPVVVSEHVALAEDVRRAGAGLVVPCDVEHLSRALATLIGDPDLRHRMGEAGRRLARSRFSWPLTARRLAALYARLSESPPSRMVSGE
jgi:glycosyltransferase involved in cell wall biosynthesis